MGVGLEIAWRGSTECETIKNQNGLRKEEDGRVMMSSKQLHIERL